MKYLGQLAGWLLSCFIGFSDRDHNSCLLVHSMIVSGNLRTRLVGFDHRWIYFLSTNISWNLLQLSLSTHPGLQLPSTAIARRWLRWFLWMKSEFCVLCSLYWNFKQHMQAQLSCYHSSLNAEWIQTSCVKCLEWIIILCHRDASMISQIIISSTRRSWVDPKAPRYYKLYKVTRIKESVTFASHQHAIAHETSGISSSVPIFQYSRSWYQAQTKQQRDTHFTSWHASRTCTSRTGSQVSRITPLSIVGCKCSDIVLAAVLCEMQRSW